jgi:hypothetical protein
MQQISYLEFSAIPHAKVAQFVENELLQSIALLSRSLKVEETNIRKVQDALTDWPPRV